MPTKIKTAAAGLVIGSGAAVVLFLLYRSSTLQTENQALQFQLEQARATTKELRSQLVLARNEKLGLQAQTSELRRLRNAMAQIGDKTKEQAPPAKPLPPAQTQPADRTAAAKPPAIQFQSLEEMADYVGQLRKVNFGNQGEPISAEQKNWLKAIKPQLEQLERSPSEFALFQSTLISHSVDLDDPDKLDKIQQIIRETYEQAVAEKLDIPSKPRAGLEDWKRRRQQLDRLGTEAVEEVLSDGERETFDRVFIGIMGVDLGTGVDKSLYPEGFLVDSP